MSNLEIAKINANFIHDFFASLKDQNFSPLIRFTFITGITRYALTSMETGANHMHGILLAP
jgi:hypothetical protein